MAPRGNAFVLVHGVDDETSSSSFSYLRTCDIVGEAADHFGGFDWCPMKLVPSAHIQRFLVACIVFAGHTGFVSPALAHARDGATSKSSKPAVAHKRFRVIKKVEFGDVGDQGRSNTCWDFATSSFLESEVRRLGGPAVDLSEMYFVRHAYPKKADTYLRLHGDATFWEGGQNHDVIRLLRDYGAVLESSYPARKNAQGELDHREIGAVLRGFLDVLLKQRDLSEAWSAGFAGILDAYLGQLPQVVTWAGRQYTPLQFSQQVLRLRADDYVELTSYTHHPFYSFVNLEVPDNWAHQSQYYNVPVQDMQHTFEYAIANGFSIAWGGDVSDPGFQKREHGYAMLSDEKTPISQAMRQRAFDSWRTTDDHSMHVVGQSQDEKGNRFYLVKDSYGVESGPYGGLLHMSERYLLLNTVYFLVHRDGLPPELRERISAGSARAIP